MKGSPHQNFPGLAPGMQQQGSNLSLQALQVRRDIDPVQAASLTGQALH
jgi:hypothetical protein